MILSNLRLVVKIAHDYVNLGLSLLDLISEGNIGLTKAVGRFDPTKGAKLSTYAAWWIKQSIKRALANQSKTIRLPVHFVDKIAKVRRVSLQMSDELGREPTDEELGEEIGIASGKVAKLKSLGIRPVSLDAVVGDEDSAEFSEMIGDEDAETPFESLRDKNLLRQMDGLLDVLDQREKRIISQRFGLGGGKRKTLEDIGKTFGVTRERIRQLQNIALAKLRRALSKIRPGSWPPLSKINEHRYTNTWPSRYQHRPLVRDAQSADRRDPRPCGRLVFQSRNRVEGCQNLPWKVVIGRSL